MDSPDSDAALMLRLRHGEDTALNELMNRWQRPLVSFIHRYVGNEADALDLAQETFVRVFESRHRYKPSGKFSSWLFAIASNLCRNLFRWQHRHPTIPITSNTNDDQGSLLDLLPDGGDSPTDTAERDDVAAAVREEIHALPHELKTVVLLFEYQEMSHEEIAGVLGCSAKAVETRLYRARKRLRQKLASWKLK